MSVEWISDHRGNRASVIRFGSREAAQAALDSLRECTDCVDCVACEMCKGCTGCLHCVGLVKCISCAWCYSYVASQYLVGCRCCEDCEDSVDCTDCTTCRGCVGCTACQGCRNANDLKNKVEVSGPGFTIPKIAIDPTSGTLMFDLLNGFASVEEFDDEAAVRLVSVAGIEGPN